MDTLGVVEVRSIAAGVDLADGMLKAADVELMRASTVCSGRYLIFVSGEREAVSTSLHFARDSGRALSGAFVISNVSPGLLAALKRGSQAREGDALAVIECRNVSSGINAADIALKRAAVDLLRLITGQGINGKAYFVLGGDVAAVREAAAAAQESLGDKLIELVVLPRPETSLVWSLTGGVR